MCRVIWKKVVSTGCSRKQVTKRNSLSLTLAAFLSFGVVGSAVAQELSIPCDEVEEKALAEAKDDEVKRISAFTPAAPLERVDPKYPSSAARKGREGWVRLSYVIDEEGRVKDQW